MMRQPACFYCCIAVIACSAWARVGDAGTVAHWSFDAPTLTLDDNGNIVGAADSTGNHNAVHGTGIGTASTANGGPTFTSNTIPGTNSVAGQYSEALTLTGNNNFAGGGGQFLMFPNLTELMTANGAPSYTVSYWINTTSTNSQQFTLLSDWGNASPNPGRFVYGFGYQISSGNAQMRGQTRTLNQANPTDNGADIFARAVTTAALNNGEWHMLTWTFDSEAGQLRSYFDGALVDTFDSTQVNGFKLIDSRSAWGSFGLKGDSGNFINGTVTLDEVWVLDTAVPAGAVLSLYNNNAVPEPSSLLLASCVGMALVMIGRSRCG